MPSWMLILIVVLVGGSLAAEIIKESQRSRKLRVLRERGYYITVDKCDYLYTCLVDAQQGVVLLAGPKMTMEHVLELTCAAHLAHATVVAKCIITLGHDEATISPLVNCIGNIAMRQEATETLLKRWAKDKKSKGYAIKWL
ncbi:MAG: hypothetical protein WAP74_03960 [Patescibacteria group bacterium]